MYEKKYTLGLIDSESTTSFETSMTIYKQTRCNIQEDFNRYEHRSENLKSRVLLQFCLLQ